MWWYGWLGNGKRNYFERKISFWIEEGYALYSSRPVIEKYLKKITKYGYIQKNEKLVAQYYSYRYWDYIN